jgi:hypothetical protein
MINFEQFVLDFKNSKYWNLLFDKYKVLMVQVIGSQLTEYIDDRSDIDIMVICENSPLEQEESIIRLKYEGHSVHWYYRNYKNYFDLSCKKGLTHIHANTLQYLTQDKILYVDDKFKPALEFLLENKNEISKIAAKRFTIIFNKHIADTLENNLSEAYYTKWLSHLMICYSVLTNMQIDYDLLMAIKRIRWLPTTEEQRTQCCEILRELRVLIEGEDINALTNELKCYSNIISNLILL